MIVEYVHLLYILLATPVLTISIEPSRRRDNIKHAIITIRYKERETSEIREDREKATFGIYGTLSHINGRLVYIRNKNDSKLCMDFVKLIPYMKWVALVKKSQCRYQDKILKASKQYNASGVIMFSEDDVPRYSSTKVTENEAALLYIKRDLGERITRMLESGTVITVDVSLSESSSQFNMPQSISRTSVLFVSISFIVLMIISLAWLIFYYIQRFRYAHAKERLSRRLANAAKKAIARIPQKTVKAGDKELEHDCDHCAICIEIYKSADVLRILPCKHVFHKSCIDPWLMDQRSCPMCKLDILRAFGLQLNGSQESVAHADGESGAPSGIEVDPLSVPEEPSSSSATSATSGLKLMHFSHPSVQFHHAPSVQQPSDNHVYDADELCSLTQDLSRECDVESAEDEIIDDTQLLMAATLAKRNSDNSYS